MNCSEFENIVVDLAQSEMRSVLLNETMKQQGRQHAQGCVPCARRLKVEQNLSRGLRAVAAGDQSLNAPATVEAALLAAFRAQNEATSVATNILVPTFSASPLRQFFLSLRWALIPAVAAALVLLVFAVARRSQAPASPQPMIVNGATPVASAMPSAPEQIVVPAPQSEPEEQPDLVVRVGTRTPTQVKAKLPRQRTGRVTVDVGPFELDEPEAISAKDFLVFDYAQTLPPADSVQLMRVRMPRERLAPLGIPLPRETRNENFVNADFLVGSDGVPRAIRVASR